MAMKVPLSLTNVRVEVMSVVGLINTLSYTQATVLYCISQMPDSRVKAKMSLKLPSLTGMSRWEMCEFSYGFQ